MRRVHILRRVGAVTIAALALSGCSGEDGNSKAEDASALAVQTVKLQSASWPRQVTASGALTAWQEAIISAETGPLRIATIDADVGTVVRKGQVLATLARESLEADRAKLKAQVEEAEANLSKAANDVERTKLIGDSGGLSAQQIESYRVTQRTARATVSSMRAQLHSVEIQLGQTTVRAVDDGVVSSRTALLGKVVNSGDELFRIVRQARIEWQAELDARQLAQVQAGQAAQVKLPDGQIVKGTVRLVAPTLNSNTSRGIAYVELPKDSAARAGMYGSGTIETINANVMTLPDTAVVLRDGKSYVFIVQSGNKVKQQTVTAGLRREGRVAVEGVAADADIVETGGAFLSDGVTVRVERGVAK